MDEKKYTYANVTGNIVSHPQRVCSPSSEKEVEDVVRQCIKEKTSVTISGFGHSTSPLLYSPGVLILSQNLRGIEVDVKNKRIWIEAGVNIQEINTILTQYNLCLPHTPVSNAFFGVGCISSGSHGSGIRFKGMSDFVEGIRMIDGKGEWVNLNRKHPDFSAAMTSLGTLGMIYGIWLRVEDNYNVQVTDSRVSLESLKDPKSQGELRERVLKNEVCDWNYFVYNDTIWIHEFSKTASPVSLWQCGSCVCSCSCCCKCYSDNCLKAINSGQRLEDAFATPLGQGLLNNVLSTPSEAPTFSKFTNLYIPNRTFVEPITSAIHWTHLFNTIPVKFLEIAFIVDEDFKNVFQAWDIVLKKLEEYKGKGKYPLNSMIQSRFTGESEALIGRLNSKTKSENTIVCWIEMVSFVKYGSETKEFDEFAGEVGVEWMKLNGARPHWAKDFRMVPGIMDTLHERYQSNLREMKEIQERYDPYGLFLNDFTREILNV